MIKVYMKDADLSFAPIFDKKHADLVYRRETLFKGEFDDATRASTFAAKEKKCKRN
jgi:hypothetical protein